MIKQMILALKLLFFLTLLTGCFYPVLVTLVAQLAFPLQANGSLIFNEETLMGSELIGQFFDDPKYFGGRYSATKPYPYNALHSGGSNLGPLNAELINGVKKRIEILQKSDKDNHQPIPIELITASGSGLDPDISIRGARYQIGRIAKIRHLKEPDIEKLIEQHKKGRQFWFLGNPRVNVLKLNLSLDAIQRQNH